jgi:alkylhydroperoxidase family enzyme
MDINSAVGRGTGLSDDEIAAILSGDESPFSPAERVLLHLCDELSATPANVDDALYAELKSHFTEEQLIEFVSLVGHENYRARFNRAFDIGSDNLYCVIPAHHPARKVET